MATKATSAAKTTAAKAVKHQTKAATAAKTTAALKAVHNQNQQTTKSNKTKHKSTLNKAAATTTKTQHKAATVHKSTDQKRPPMGFLGDIQSGKQLKITPKKTDTGKDNTDNKDKDAVELPSEKELRERKKKKYFDRISKFLGRVLNDQEKETEYKAYEKRGQNVTDTDFTRTLQKTYGEGEKVKD